MRSPTGGTQGGKVQDAVRALCSDFKDPLSGSQTWRHCSLKVMLVISVSFPTEKGTNLAHQNHLGSLKNSVTWVPSPKILN